MAWLDLIVQFGKAGLLERMKAVQVANREGQVERERQAGILADAREARAAAGLFDPVGQGGALPPLVLDEVSAQRGGYPVAMGWAKTVRPGNAGTIQVWSADFTSTLTVPYGFPETTVPPLTRTGAYISGPDDPSLVYSINAEIDISAFTGDRIQLPFVLPIGKDTFLYCLTVRESFGYTLQTVTINWPNSSSPQPTPTVNDYGSGTRNYNETLCFLVGRSTVRQVAAPSGLLSRLADAYPEFNYPTSSSVGTAPNNGVFVEISTPYGQRVVQALTNPTGTLARTVVGVTGSLPDSTYPPRDRISKWTAYGFFAQAPEYGTPAIYSFLNTYADQYNGDPPPFTANDVRTAYLDGLPFPRVLLYPAAEIVADIDTGILSVYNPTNDYFNGSTYPELIPDVFRRNRPGKLTVAPENVPLTQGEDGASLLRAWDWGKPGCCREQLLALGFTAADLTP